MRIAVLGGGYAGVAISWHLLQHSGIALDLYDPAGIGGFASGLAAGLMHPFAGRHAKLQARGREGMAASLELIEAAERAAGASVCDRKGILRIALSEEQRQDFAECAESHPEVEWWNDCSLKVSGAPAAPGAYIRSGVTVNSKAYLEGLWKACEALGGNWISQGVDSLEEIDTGSYDAVVVAMGIRSSKLLDLPLRPVKGQLLEYAWPETLAPLPFSLNSKAYLTMGEGGKSVIAGATFERRFDSEEPDWEIAKEEILEKAEALYPPLREMRLIDCRAAIRASTPDHRPIARHVSGKVWALTGLGSKGLLYHALLAKELSGQILSA